MQYARPMSSTLLRRSTATILSLAFAMHVGSARADEPAASASGSAAASASLSTPTASSPASTTATAPNQEETKEKSDPTARKVIAASAIGFGAISLGIWIAQLAKISSLRDDQTAQLQSVPSGVDPCAVSPSSAYFAAGHAACSREDDISGARASGWVAFGFGLALVTTGVVLLVTEKKESKSEPSKTEPSKASWQFAPVVGPTTGFAATGTF